MLQGETMNRRDFLIRLSLAVPAVKTIVCFGTGLWLPPKMRVLRGTYPSLHGPVPALRGSIEAIVRVCKEEFSGSTAIDPIWGESSWDLEGSLRRILTSRTYDGIPGTAVLLVPTDDYKYKDEDDPDRLLEELPGTTFS